MPVMLLFGSEAMSDKIHGQEGNSPERQLRSLIYAKLTGQVIPRRKYSGAKHITETASLSLLNG